jgi:electron-transferring-flavoprotein dehydrogenase
VSLARLCQWLATQAEELGCHIFPGFAATELLYGAEGQVAGVVTGAMGLDASGAPKPGFQAGYELRARYVVFAEGCRGSLGKELEAKYALREQAAPQHYGIGFKEIWNVAADVHHEGTVLHTLGWPLDNRTEGGGFLYHAADRQVYLGFVVALSYRNPHLSPFSEFQRWKQHPKIRAVLEGATRVGYGARAVNKGGLQSLPKLVVPGGVLVGCEAGFLNPAKIKGSHTAIKSGILAAEALFAELGSEHPAIEPVRYAAAVRDSWLQEELVRARNFSPALSRFGTFLGAALTFLEHNVLRGYLPLTLNHRKVDHALQRADQSRKIAYPKPDNRISFDRLSSVFLANIHHDEDQPAHLLLADPDLPVRENLPRYDEPAQRYCPAAVYEIVQQASGPTFRINASNCIHCKTCDIKDPAQNITWVPPEGGSGPNYVGM